MNEFKLSDGIDKDKIFFVNLSKLEGRIDPNFYTQKYIHLVNKIKSRKYYKLKDVSESFKNGSTPKGGKFLTKGVLYYRSQNFDLFNLKKNTFISNEFNKKIDRSHCKINDIMLAVVGATLGKIGFINFYEDEGNINQNVARIRIKSNFFISKFIAIYLWLDIGQLLIKRNATITAQPYLNNEELGKILIPSICLNIQQDIINMVGKAYLSKQQKEKQAKDLLNSIDIYLLDELGITLPKIDNSLEKRIFEISLSEISEKRFDPFYYKYCTDVMKSIKYEEFDVIELANIQKGQSITSRDIIKGDYDVIAGGKSSPYSHNQYNFKGNVITISASGAYSGYAWYHTNYIFASDCNIIQSKDENKITTIFIFEILKLKQTELYNLQQGSGQPHVYADDIKKIKIPLPPIEKQNEIAEHVQKIRDTAKQLKTEAVQYLKNAKLEVEKMILGQ
jgi:restriction endonuclease S subunit